MVFNGDNYELGNAKDELADIVVSKEKGYCLLKDSLSSKYPNDCYYFEDFKKIREDNLYRRVYI